MDALIARRTLLAAGLAAALPVPAAAQGSSIRFIVPYPAGGATDVLARLLGQKVQEAWGQPVIVENRVGNSGTIGTAFVAKAPPDSLTVLVTITALIQQPSLMEGLPYEPLRDFAPVVQIARTASVFAVPLDSPATSLREFVVLMRASPGKHSFGTYGAGTSAHIHGALLNQQAGLDLVHVPFNGSAPLLAALMGSQVPCGFVDSASARPQLKAIRPLAVTGTQRMPALPEVPTFQELGYHSFEPYGWFGMFVPAATPAPLVLKLSEELNRILKQPEIATRIEGLGLQVAGGSADEFRKVVRADAATYARIIREANIRLTK
ncbi:MAG TPA: tripartite tricarboxylate transporter substrate binding protein [Ramlibacter sp.]|jgi:tripartite-type tricarboxylate transporter receptor subunit TctC|nr:tripartite tricarboxylate transporter substrate binding protein [Ramlibacter sp.]